MAVGAAFLQYVLEQVERAGRVTSRRMFGGVGLYCDDVFFGLIDDDTLYFKVGDATRADYEARGGKPFRPYADRPEVSMSYYTVPADILDDAEELVAWARRSIAIAAASPKPTRKTRHTTSKPARGSQRTAPTPKAKRTSSPQGKTRRAAPPRAKRKRAR